MYCHNCYLQLVLPMDKNIFFIKLSNNKWQISQIPDLCLYPQGILKNNNHPSRSCSGSFVLFVSLLSNTKMDEGVSVKHEGKNVDIKQEKQENVDSFKYEFDSGSQDSSKSGSGGYQRWAPNLNGVRKSAFTPYKSVQCTALTNLQRGNIIYTFLSAMSGYS